MLSLTKIIKVYNSGKVGRAVASNTRCALNEAMKRVSPILPTAVSAQSFDLMLVQVSRILYLENYPPASCRRQILVLARL